MENVKLLIGKRIKEAREYRGLTQEKLAELSGISWSSISRLENGNSMVSVLELIEIADALNVGLEVFLCDFMKTGIDGDSEDIELMNHFRDLDESDRRYILDSIELLKKHHKRR